MSNKVVTDSPEVFRLFACGICKLEEILGELLEDLLGKKLGETLGVLVYGVTLISKNNNYMFWDIHVL